MLLDAKHLHPGRSTRSHLLALAATHGIGEARVQKVIELTGLDPVAGKRAGAFSLGMGQRLGIAAALLGDPHTLILDEPSNGLDPDGITWLRNLLKQLASEGRSVLVSSHLLPEMALLADELVVIGRGRMLANGPVADFTRSSARASVTVTSPDATTLAESLTARGGHVTVEGSVLTVTRIDAEVIGDAAYEIGARIHQLVTHVATLEEAFLDATGGSQEFRGGAS